MLTPPLHSSDKLRCWDVNVVELLKENRRAKRQWKHNANLNYWTWSSKIKHPAPPSAKKWQSTLMPHLFKVGSCIPTSSWYIVTPPSNDNTFLQTWQFYTRDICPLGVLEARGKRQTCEWCLPHFGDPRGECVCCLILCWCLPTVLGLWLHLSPLSL